MQFKSFTTAGWIVLLFLSTTFSQYLIPSFETGARTIPPSGNEIILPFEGTTLRQVTAVPDLKPGEVLLRRRFSSNEYGLFIGKMNNNAYSRLSAFRLQGSSLSQSAARKYYGQQVTNPDDDLPNVYFDKDMVYLENTARLYYNDNGWQELKMEAKLPARLTVTSDPPGATVLIDGVEKGTTPYYAGALFSTSVVAQLKMEGYYLVEDFINLEGKGQVTKKFVLSKRLFLSTVGEIDSQTYAAKNTENVDELTDRIADIDKKLEAQKNSVQKNLDAFEKAYPPLPPKGEFEKTAAFKEREKNYNEQKATEKEKISNASETVIGRLTAIESQVKQYKDSLEKCINQAFFPADSLKLGAYDADSEAFPVTLAISESDFDFTFLGRLNIPIDIAPKFKQQPGEGKIRLSYLNQAIRVTKEDKNLKRYFDFKELKLEFMDREFVLNGSFGLPEYLTGSEGWKGMEQKKIEAEAEKERIVDVYIDKGKYSEAITEINGLLAKKRTNPLLQKLAKAQFATGKYADAIASVEEIKTSDPENLEAIMVLGRVLAAQKKYNEAIEVYKEALYINESYVPAMVERANVYLIQSKYPWAKTFYERALMIDPKNAMAHIGLAKVAKASNDVATCQAEIEKAKALDPEDKDIADEIESLK